jgi:outer membrane protein
MGVREQEDRFMRLLSLSIAAALALRLLMEPITFGNAEAAPADTLALSLEQSVRIAVANNANVRLGRERVLEASANAREARTAFLPQLAGSAGYTRLDVAPYIPASRFMMFTGAGASLPGGVPDKITIGLVDNYFASLELRQPLFAAGRIRNAYDISKLARDALESDLDYATNELVFETKKAYLECVQAQKLEDVALETVRQLEGHLRDLQAKFDAGLAATNDVLKTNVYYSDSKLALMKSRHAVHIARKSLCDLIGVPLTTEIALTSTTDSVAATAIDLDTAVKTAVARRPELASIAHRKRMAQRQIEIERSGHLPTVSLFADLSYQYPNREYEKDFYTSWKLGVAAEMNVFDWGRTAFRAQQSRSRLRQIEISEQSVRDAIVLDVTRTYMTLLDAWDEIEVARENVAQADENLRVTNEEFNEGLATNTDLLDAEVLLTAAKTTYRNTMAAYLIARADFDRATGGMGN